MESNAARIPALDGVRGLAVLAVVVHNTAWIGSRHRELSAKMYSAAAAAGWTGVQLFFVLSGFLITGILLDDKGTAGCVRRFFVRRTLRIFPLYFATLGTVVVLAAAGLGPEVWSRTVLTEQWPYWLYVSNWTDPFRAGINVLSHVWSLAVEEQFYVLWPAIVWSLSSRSLLQLTVGMVALGPLVRLAMHVDGMPSEALYMFTTARMDALATGALVAILVRDEGHQQSLSWWTPRIATAATLALVALVLTQRGFHSNEVPIAVVGQSLVSLLAACVVTWGIGATSVQLHWLKRLLDAGALPRLGNYSYAIYMFHYPLHRKLQPFFTAWVNTHTTPSYLLRLGTYSLVVLLLSYLLARISWVLVERPFLSLRSRWAPAAGKLEARRPAITPAM